MMKMIFSLLFLICISVMTAPGQNSKADSKHIKAGKQKTNFALFESDKILDFSLLFDLKRYYKKDFKEPLDGVITFRLNEKDSVTEKVKVTNRGSFRSSNCNLPPLEISFIKGIKLYSGQGKINKLKFVTCCETGGLYDEYILREYLVYRMFNVLTDTSFRIRLCKVTLSDSRFKIEPVTQYGFFIEPKEIMAGRTDLAVVKTKDLSQKDIVPAVMDRLAIFNYMISNFDWSLKEEHNVAILSSQGKGTGGSGIAIPFDFDQTGVVNPVYAAPPIGTGSKSIRDRRYLGPCRSRMEFQKDLKYFLSRKEKLYNVINEFQYLDLNSKKDILKFLDEFFIKTENLKSIDSLIDYFQSVCNKS
jgi:hypothetical protein